MGAAQGDVVRRHFQHVLLFPSRPIMLEDRHDDEEFVRAVGFVPGQGHKEEAVCVAEPAPAGQVVRTGEVKFLRLRMRYEGKLKTDDGNEDCRASRYIDCGGWSDGR